jgi:hypothetical protein
MKRHRDPTRIVMIMIRAILIAAAILILGRFFGLHVREAGGRIIAAKIGVAIAQSGGGYGEASTREI